MTIPVEKMTSVTTSITMSEMLNRLKSSIIDSSRKVRSVRKNYIKT